MNEPIKRVIERCEYRIDRFLDCNVDDIRRLVSEVQRLTPQVKKADVPSWHGLGSGD